MWTRFMDMHSGGRSKEPFPHIYIEAPKHEAVRMFEDRFGHNPENITCQHCGPDYSINENNTLEQATGYERGCDYDIDLGYIEKPRYGYETCMPLEKYTKEPYVLILYAKDLK